jgi:hypothetical protein
MQFQCQLSAARPVTCREEIEKEIKYLINNNLNNYRFKISCPAGVVGREGFPVS